MCPKNLIFKFVIIVKNWPKLSTLSKCWSGHVYLMSSSKVLCQWVSDVMTRLSIEPFWTVKNEMLKERNCTKQTSVLYCPKGCMGLPRIPGESAVQKLVWPSTHKVSLGEETGYLKFIHFCSYQKSRCLCLPARFELIFSSGERDQVSQACPDQWWWASWWVPRTGNHLEKGRHLIAICRDITWYGSQ